MGGVAEIPIVNSDHVLLVDEEDAFRIAAHKWYLMPEKGNLYARTIACDGRHVRAHRLILQGRPVDHINGDGLDNRKSNLRVCSVAENNCNRRQQRTSKQRWKGYYFDSHLDQFRAQISVSNKTTHLGLFDNELDAAKAYDAAASKYYGEFARLNFPQDGVS